MNINIESIERTSNNDRDEFLNEFNFQIDKFVENVDFAINTFFEMNFNIDRDEFSNEFKFQVDKFVENVDFTIDTFFETNFNIDYAILLKREKRKTKELKQKKKYKVIMIQVNYFDEKRSSSELKNHIYTT